MYRRKSSRWATSYRSRSYGARRGPLTRVATRPRIWNRANFFFEGSIAVPNNSDTSTNLAVLLARIQNLQDSATAAGRAANDQVRWLEIGGIVFDYGLRREALYDVGTGAGLGTSQHYCLATDRFDSAGNPNTLPIVQWQRSQPPVANAPAVSAGAENQDFPTKIHWRKFERTPHYAVTVNAGEGELVAPEGQYLVTRNPTLNKRLRLRLDPAQGLFFSFSVITGPAYAAGGTLGWTAWIQGQLFYRVRQ